MKGETLLIRADAGVRRGTGHVMRCLALAQAWQDRGGRVTFAAAELPVPMQQRLAEEKMSVRLMDAAPGSRVDAVQTAAQAHSLGTDWVVVDGYQFGCEFQKALKGAGLRVLVVDDYGHCAHYHADLILNQNLYAETVPYAAPGAHLLLGTSFSLLRREFRVWSGWERAVPPHAQNILVTMGGADPDNVTQIVIRALGLLECERWEAVVVVGASNPHFGALEDTVRECRIPVRLERAVRDMPALMAWADLAISAAGSTCWELCFMGVPICCTVLADNQAQVAESLSQRGAAIDLGWGSGLRADAAAARLSKIMEDGPERGRISRVAQSLVDGKGGSRVLAALNSAQESL